MIKLDLNNYLKYKFLNLVSLFLTLIIVGAIIYLGFWEFNILREEADIKQEIKEISEEVKKLSGLNLEEESLLLKSKLPQPQVLSQPTITVEMIGKNNWFE